MPTTDYFFINIKPAPIIVIHPAAHQNKPTAQQAATQDPVPQLTHPFPHRQIFKMHFDLFVCVPMAEKKVQKTKVQSDYLSDSDTSEEEVNPQLHMSEEERIYGMI